jgi:hypothetical protein
MIGEEQPKSFGHGWISGTLSATLGAIGLGAVLCFHYPWVLTMPELREVYPIPYVRALLHLILVSSFVLGIVSIILRRSKFSGLAGITLTLVAALLGGSQVPIDGEMTDGPFLGLDWFLLNLIAFRFCSYRSNNFSPSERNSRYCDEAGGPT